MVRASRDKPNTVFAREGEPEDSYEFEFDKVVSEKKSQAEVFAVAKPYARAALKRKRQQALFLFWPI